MKKLICLLILISGISCSEGDQMSHTETAKLVAESFINKDNNTLEKYTTPQRYRSLVSVQDMVTSTYSGDTNFKVVRDTVYSDTAWIKFTTSHEQKPETFKLIKEGGQWKVTETGLREKSPF